MDIQNRKEHWEQIYKSKDTEAVSWFQSSPDIFVAILNKFRIPESAKLIDIGGGDSLWVDFTLNNGYPHVTVLDLSETATLKTQERLMDRARLVKWIVSDVTRFHPEEKYDFWHDRAAFHFLTDDNDISDYIETAQKFIQKEGFLMLGTFSDTGPLKCSGQIVRRYSEESMSDLLSPYFENMEFIRADHTSPSGVTQNFIYGIFKRRSDT